MQPNNCHDLRNLLSYRHTLTNGHSLHTHSATLIFNVSNKRTNFPYKISFALLSSNNSFYEIFREKYTNHKTFTGYLSLCSSLSGNGSLHFDGRRLTPKCRHSARPVPVAIMSHSDTSEHFGMPDASPTAAAVTASPF